MDKAILTRKQIFVNNKDLGFFTQTPITVQGFQSNGDGDLELIYCNHANAQFEKVEVSALEWDRELGYLPTGTAWQDCLVCDKCDAYRFVDSKDWEDAPFEGEFYVS